MNLSNCCNAEIKQNAKCEHCSKCDRCLSYPDEYDNLTPPTTTVEERKRLAQELGLYPIENIDRVQHAYQDLSSKEWITNERLDHITRLIQESELRGRYEEAYRHNDTVRMSEINTELAQLKGGHDGEE